jgi:hypothetical protein
VTVPDRVIRELLVAVPEPVDVFDIVEVAVCVIVPFMVLEGFPEGV